MYSHYPRKETYLYSSISNTKELPEADALNKSNGIGISQFKTQAGAFVSR